MQINKHYEVRHQLIHALSASKSKPDPDESEFSASAFFSAWFQELGSAYYFLFKKNLRVTNIQFAELLALIRVHTSLSDGAPIRDIQFLSRAEFTEAFSSLFEDFRQENSSFEDVQRLVSEYYDSLIKPVIVLDSFFGSCAVFVPPHLNLDIRSMCAESGYIHSCGRNIFTRNVSKAKKSKFFESVDAHLKKFHEHDKKLFFATYAHEDFTKFDRDQAPDLRDGLDDVKVYIEKFHMGSDSLVKVLKDMQSEPEFKNKLVIPDPGDYREKHVEMRSDVGVRQESSILLVVDRSVGDSDFTPGETRYYICYEQEYRNSNPFHIFDENKPAWIAHTTIPHTLGGAMLNVSRPWWPSKNVVVADPFVGSGTLYLEGLKFSEVDLRCSDIEAIAPLLAKDNLDFFSLSQSEIENIIKRLESLVKEPVNPAPFRQPDSDKESLKWAFEVSKGVHPNSDYSVATFTQETVDRLDKSDLFSRMLFYLSLRTTIRGVQALDREANHDRWWENFKRESSAFIKQLGRLARLKSKEVLERDGLNNLIIGKGSYSTECSLDFTGIEHRYTSIRMARAENEEMINGEPVKYDVIVTDPPYGFNTNESIEVLARLYVEVVRKMVASLKDDGQLVICLPDRSHTGRRSPYFTHRQIVTQQIFAEAESAGKEVLYSAFLVPPPSRIFRPPYYWESERALRRSILHFRLKSIR